ncbi:MAG: cryptochrome/photolyase family protein [Anaerolineales bacterium]|jgi:deoxyribodipyrimidine photolyase-related protein
MSNVSVWISGDQLLKDHPAIEQAVKCCGQENVCVVMIESDRRIARQPYQRKKLVLLLSAMRHYARDLERDGINVDYRKAGSFSEGLQAHLDERNPDKLLTMEFSSYSGRKFQRQLQEQGEVPVEVIPNTQFLVGEHNPIPSPEPEKRYVLEHFYREMRRHFNVLLDDDEPVGGEWNFDASNRKRLPKDLYPPDPIQFEPDDITREVMKGVADLPYGVGSVEEFNYAVDHEATESAFEDFVANRLDLFGPYEDALTRRSHAVFHSLLSPYLNIGLLEPLPVIRRVEQLYRSGQVRIESAEGFIRQILGWREFMYWQYWRQMPGMLDQNAWQAESDIPGFFWDASTDMACLAYALERALQTGYNHHIERLMVISNFLMLTGVNPRAANDWFLSVYIDAYDWVMPPNVIGMGLNADGGLTSTKPYIASANYINKMGDFCSGCAYNHKKRHGGGACPFNYLYWNFILKHEERLKSNPRTSRNVLGLRYLDDEDRELVQQEAEKMIRSFGK